MINPIPRGDYPRPQLRRAQWQCLNGPWRIRADDAGEGLKQRWHQVGLGAEAQTIMVPFTPQAPASQAEALRHAACLWSYELSYPRCATSSVNLKLNHCFPEISLFGYLGGPPRFLASKLKEYLGSHQAFLNLLKHIPLPIAVPY